MRVACLKEMIVSVWKSYKSFEDELTECSSPLNTADNDAHRDDTVGQHDSWSHYEENRTKSTATKTRLKLE